MLREASSFRMIAPSGRSRGRLDSMAVANVVGVVSGVIAHVVAQALATTEAYGAAMERVCRDLVTSTRISVGCRSTLRTVAGRRSVA